jgi:hypothetical protein
MVINRNTGNSAQNNHYYPFGLTMSVSDNQGVQPYKYTGKELDMEHGLVQMTLWRGSMIRRRGGSCRLTRSVRSIIG